MNGLRGTSIVKWYGDTNDGVFSLSPTGRLAIGIGLTAAAIGLYFILKKKPTK